MKQTLTLILLLSSILSSSGLDELDDSTDRELLSDIFYYSTSSSQDLGGYNPTAAAGNPLKGIIGNPWFSRFDFSVDSVDSSMDIYYLEFHKVMLNDPNLVGVENAFNWTYVEEALNDSVSRYRHAVLTTVIHYPGAPLWVPDYLLRKGLRLEYYPDFLGGGQSPDYGDPIILEAIEQYITALGKKYDGDYRIAYIHAGLLGYWGEWHTHPYNFVPQESKHSVTEWYAHAFNKTHIQVRYPFQPAYEAGFGLYDGSFAFFTLDGDANGGIDHPEWYFWPLVQNTSQTDFWKHSVMGGETRPELQQIIFEPDYPVGTYEKQDFIRCVLTTHTTYVFHQDAFVDGGYSGEELVNILHAHVTMGYNFIVTRVGVSESNNEAEVDVSVTIKQQGPAPFYYPLSLGLDCQELAEPIVLDGVETVVENGDTKEFTFMGVPATSLCLNNVSFQLLSPYRMEGRPIRFAQGLEGMVSVSLPLPLDEADKNVTVADWGDIGNFTLIKSLADSYPHVLGPIASGDVFDLSDVGNQLTVGVETIEETKSVTYRYAGTTHRVSTPPYILGSDVNGVGQGVPYLATTGNKTLTATAIDGLGVILGSSTVTFELIDAVPPPKPTPSPALPGQTVHGFNTPNSPNLLDEISPGKREIASSTSIAVYAAVMIIVLLIAATVVCCCIRRRRRYGQALPCFSSSRGSPSDIYDPEKASCTISCGRPGDHRTIQYQQTCVTSFGDESATADEMLSDRTSFH